MLMNSIAIRLTKSELDCFIVSEGKITAKYWIYKGSFPNQKEFFPNVS